ncbi:MAG: ThiF family adenylyltransferase, partial [archaeon]|nr:ThiF family adenylyltransferase [archaeon]
MDEAVPGFFKEKILIIGAGGLGCELLKLLTISNFKNIAIIDMDTIEKTNLNRQFLFDLSCVGKFKAEMAAKRTLEYRKDPELKIDFKIGNIMDQTTFSDEFFKEFKLIFMALDNLEARKYVNLICMKLNIPLLNSGTEGYFGTVNFIIRGETPCFACTPKVENKTIPVCSIRDKPKKMEHCAAWGKVIFEKIFCQENQNGDTETISDFTYLNHYSTPLLIMENLFDKEIKEVKSLNKEKAEETKDKLDILNAQNLTPICLKDYFSEEEMKNLNQIAERTLN